MIVVADTSPLNYLVQLGVSGLLPSLYDEVVIPPEVLRELRAPGTPPKVSAWAAELPSWIRTETAPTLSPSLRVSLDPGESAAISLALELRVRDLLIDEARGRRVATELGLVVVGTVGVLLDADENELLDAAEYFERLCKLTSFYSNKALRRSFYDALAQRRQQGTSGDSHHD